MKMIEIWTTTWEMRKGVVFKVMKKNKAMMRVSKMMTMTKTVVKIALETDPTYDPRNAALVRWVLIS